METHATTTSSWKELIYQWHVEKQMKEQKAEQQREAELEQLQQQQPRRRGRRKRRKEPSISLAEQEMQVNVLEWYDQNIGLEAQRARKRPKREGAQEEDKAHALQHLWLRHRGEGSVGKLDTMVQLSSGKGTVSGCCVAFV